MLLPSTGTPSKNKERQRDTLCSSLGTRSSAGVLLLAAPRSKQGIYSTMPLPSSLKRDSHTNHNICSLPLQPSSESQGYLNQFIPSLEDYFCKWVFWPKPAKAHIVRTITNRILIQNLQNIWLVFLLLHCRPWGYSFHIREDGQGCVVKLVRSCPKATESFRLPPTHTHTHEGRVS